MLQIEGILNVYHHVYHRKRKYVYIEYTKTRQILLFFEIMLQIKWDTDTMNR